MSNPLFSTYLLGKISLKNRVVMAPMTRSRSPGNIPGEVVAKYYAQRTEAGLIITEGTSPSPNGVGYARIPGLYSAEQVAGWRLVAQGIRAGASHAFVQLMHTGRIGHPANLPAGARVLGPSAIAAPGQMYTDAQGMQAFPVPIAMSEAEIEQALGEFVTAARNAVDAGFDGVELHGANGYLIDQFLNLGANQRADGWGGTIEGRIRFALEAARRVSAAIGPDRVGIRLSPYGAFNGMITDPDHEAVFVRLAQELSKLRIAYVHLVDHSSMGAPAVPERMKRAVREAFEGTLILSGGYEAKRAGEDLEAQKADLIAFGRPWISNPHLVSKLKSGEALAPSDPATYYAAGEKGYIDYA